MFRTKSGLDLLYEENVAFGIGLDATAVIGCRIFPVEIHPIETVSILYKTTDETLAIAGTAG